MESESRGGGCRTPAILSLFPKPPRLGLTEACDGGGHSGKRKEFGGCQS